MLKTFHVSVQCRIDNQIKDFYFTVTPDNQLGLRYGCNEKTGCQQCRDCWLDVRETIKMVDSQEPEQPLSAHPRQ